MVYSLGRCIMKWPRRTGAAYFGPSAISPEGSPAACGDCLRSSAHWNELAADKKGRLRNVQRLRQRHPL
jgi:hypothetical protein